MVKIKSYIDSIKAYYAFPFMYETYSRIICSYLLFFNPVSAKFIKWSNTLKQIVGKLRNEILQFFDFFTKLEKKFLWHCHNLQTVKMN